MWYIVFVGMIVLTGIAAEFFGEYVSTAFVEQVALYLKLGAKCLLPY